MQHVLLPPANVVCEGYVFTGVCLSTGGRGMENPPGWRTPPDGEPPLDGEPPGWRTPQPPPDGEPPGWRTPPDGEPPLDGEPPGWRTPGWRTPPDGEPPPRSMCGRYASYWNAFLLSNCFVQICPGLKFRAHALAKTWAFSPEIVIEASALLSIKNILQN